MENKLEKITSTKSGVKVYWDDVKGASKYHIYRKTGSGSYKLLETVTSTNYTDKTAKKGKTYSYRVYAGYSSYKSSYKSELKIKDKY